MLIYISLLVLCFPFIALGSPVNLQELISKSTKYNGSTSVWTLPPSSNPSSPSLRLLADRVREKHTGDTLGITRCYCASPTWGQDNVFGHYYLWDYYNFHTNHRFLLERICHSGAMTRSGIFGSEAYQIMCLRPREDDHECMKDQFGNQFCYILNGKERKDRFKYNHQMRGLPMNSPGEKHASEAHVEETCEKICRSDKVGGLDMMKGIALVHANHATPRQDKFNVVDNEWSHISYYPEIDDMCVGCKK